MTIAALENELLAPLIRQPIREYERHLDIVERPSVGALASTREVGTLVYDVLSYGLYVCRLRGGTNVRVRCGHTTPSMLRLEIMWDQAQSDDVHGMTSLFVLGDRNREASRLGGDIHSSGLMLRPGETSNDIFIQLNIPIAP